MYWDIVQVTTGERYTDDAVVMDSWGGATVIKVNDSKVIFTHPKTLKENLLMCQD